MSVGKVSAGDTARAETTLPLAPAELQAFLGDCERLFRLNPLYAIESWEQEAAGFRFTAHNESNDRRIETTTRVERSDGTLLLHYASGLKQATRFDLEPASTGVRLIVTEHYPRIEDPQDPRVAEVDKSLVPWVAALRRHLLARRRWGRLPLLFSLWRWWHERFMPGMPPRQRRIVRLLVWTTALEFVVFLGLILALRFAA